MHTDFPRTHLATQTFRRGRKPEYSRLVARVESVRAPNAPARRPTCGIRQSSWKCSFHRTSHVSYCCAHRNGDIVICLPSSHSASSSHPSTDEEENNLQSFQRLRLLTQQLRRLRTWNDSPLARVAHATLCYYRLSIYGIEEALSMFTTLPCCHPFPICWRVVGGSGNEQNHHLRAHSTAIIMALTWTVEPDGPELEISHILIDCYTLQCVNIYSIYYMWTHVQYINAWSCFAVCIVCRVIFPS